jgi:DNA recombination protein RmuC
MIEQDLLIIILLAIGLMACLCLIIYFLMKGKLQSQEKEYEFLNKEFQNLQSDHDDQLQSMNVLHEELKSEVNTKNELHSQFIRLQSDYDNLKTHLDELKSDQKAQLEKFKLLASEVLQKQGEHLNERQQKDLKVILDPLKEKIKAFEDKVEKSNTESVKRHESLKEQIKYLSENSKQVSLDAQKLAKALQGDYKKQGNWGELILESILDKSGLEKGREYEVQVTGRNQEGKMQRPDVIIHLPDGKRLIIDSKVSLNAYNAFVNAENESEGEQYRKSHILAIQKHVKDLSAKNYQSLYPGNSPDFVLMFIPIDTAFSVALQGEPELYQHAFEQNIVIVTSSTLLATLKTVETMWRSEKQNKNALTIAEEAGKMYDKFVGFVEEMEKLGRQLDTAQNTYHDSMKKLSSGRGNLVKRAQDLKELGVKTSKSLSTEVDSN